MKECMPKISERRIIIVALLITILLHILQKIIIREETHIDLMKEKKKCILNIIINQKMKELVIEKRSKNVIVRDMKLKEI